MVVLRTPNHPRAKGTKTDESPVETQRSPCPLWGTSGVTGVSDSPSSLTQGSRTSEFPTRRGSVGTTGSINAPSHFDPRRHRGLGWSLRRGGAIYSLSRISCTVNLLVVRAGARRDEFTTLLLSECSVALIVGPDRAVSGPPPDPHPRHDSGPCRVDSPGGS